MRPDGSEREQLTFAPLKADGLDWSPDARTIAVRAQQPGKPYKIFLVSASGGDPRELLPDHRQEEGIPSWSPDGRRIVFGDVPAVFGQPAGNEVIHIYDFDTRRLSVLPGSEGRWTARWSPDGRYIAATSIAWPQHPPAGRLALYEFATQRWREIAADYVDSPIWSHDSRCIYFLCNSQDLKESSYRVRIPAGMPEHIASQSDLIFRVPFPVRWIGLSPDDSPLFLRAATTTDIYALDVDWP
jgi:Tol biopolymer transport system component